jgi:hypothetical protein
MVLCLPLTAMGAVTITASNHIFTPGNEVAYVDILMTGDQGINSADISVIIDDALSGGPKILDIDIVTAAVGLYWVDNPGDGGGFNDGGGTILNSDQDAFISVAFNNAVNPAIPGGGTVLARVLIDVTGMTLGDSWALVIDDAVNATFGPSFVNATAGPPDPQTYFNGTLQYVPEPSSVVLGLLAAAGLAAVIVRRRRTA